METAYQNELVKVNKDVWESDIRKAITDWEDFSKSNFCDTESRKKAAEAVVIKLHKMLETLMIDNGITEEQLRWFTSMI